MEFEYKSISSDREISRAISDRIKKLLEKENLSQLQLSQEMHVSKSTVNNWVHGESITLDALYNLSKFFDCSIDYLISGMGGLKSLEKNTVDDYGIGDEVKYYYQAIRDEHVNGLLYTQALNFLVSENVFRRLDGTCFTFNEFAETWTTYLSIDSNLDTEIAICDNDLRLDYFIDYKTLEELQLLKLTKILREKKESFKRTTAFEDLHRRKLLRKESILAEEELEHHLEGHPYLLGTEPSPKDLKKYAKIADPSNPIPWEDGGTL